MTIANGEVKNIYESRCRSRLGVTALLTFSFILVAPVVDIISPSAWIPLPMIFALVLAAWLLSQRMLRIDCVFAAMIALGFLTFIPWIWSASYVSIKTLVHSASVVVAASTYYLSVRCGLMITIRQRGAFAVLKAIFCSTLLVSLFVVSEFAGYNLHTWGVGTAVPHIGGPEFEALVFGFVYRARGFASEPGVMALFYDFAIFLCIPVARVSWIYCMFFWMIIVPAYLMLFSTASFICVGVGIFVIVFCNLRDRFLGASSRVLVATVLIVFVSFYAGDRLSGVAGALFFDKVGSLVQSGGVDASGSDRREKIVQIAELTSSYPFGIGFGITPGLSDVAVAYKGLPLSDGQISLLGAIVVGGGVVAGVAAAIGFLALVWCAFGIPLIGRYVAAGGISIGLHQLTVSEYWLPFIWVYAAIVSALLWVSRHGGLPILLDRRVAGKDALFH